MANQNAATAIAPYRITEVSTCEISRLNKLPYRARATGFFCLGITAIGVGAFTPDFSSIHASRSDFLNRHRFPSLNAGMNPSDAYRYNVSPLTPRYSDRKSVV